jgi:riboflavin biosynthesis pyrimidine reductase
VAGDDAAEIAAYRVARTGSAEPPPLVVVSASGDLPAHVALDQPATSVVVVTSVEGAPKVRRAHPLASVVEVEEGPEISGARVVAAVTSALGPGLILCEGGPSLFGRLLADQSAHELFLTESPAGTTINRGRASSTAGPRLPTRFRGPRSSRYGGPAITCFSATASNPERLSLRTVSVRRSSIA